MRTPLAIVAALVAMLSMGATDVHAQQTIKIGTTPSFIFLPLYAADQLGYFRASRHLLSLNLLPANAWSSSGVREPALLALRARATRRQLQASDPGFSAMAFTARYN